MDALGFRQRGFERRLLRVQKLSAAEGLHDCDAEPFRLASAIDFVPGVQAAFGVLPFTAVISRVDGKHEQIRSHLVEDLLNDRRRMGGKADVTYDAGLLQFIDVIQNPILLKGHPVLFLIQTVDESVIDVVCFQLRKLLFDRLFHSIRIQGPSVDALGIFRTEVDLIIYLLADIRQRLSEDRISVAVPRCQVEDVDAAFHGALQRADAFFQPRFKQICCAQPDLAETVACFPVYSVLHCLAPIPVVLAFALALTSDCPLSPPQVTALAPRRSYSASSLSCCRIALAVGGQP